MLIATAKPRATPTISNYLRWPKHKHMHTQHQSVRVFPPRPIGHGHRTIRFPMLAAIGLTISGQNATIKARISVSISAFLHRGQQRTQMHEASVTIEVQNPQTASTTAIGQAPDPAHVLVSEKWRMTIEERCSSVWQSAAAVAALQSKFELTHDQQRLCVFSVFPQTHDAGAAGNRCRQSIGNQNLATGQSYPDQQWQPKWQIPQAHAIKQMAHVNRK